jgi:hypothetical protein
MFYVSRNSQISAAGLLDAFLELAVIAGSVPINKITIETSRRQEPIARRLLAARDFLVSRKDASPAWVQLLITDVLVTRKRGWAVSVVARGGQGC